MTIRVAFVCLMACATASAGPLLRGNSLRLPDGTDAPLAHYPGGFTPFGGRFAMSTGMSGYSGGIASASRSRMDVAADARNRWDAHIRTLEGRLQASPNHAALKKQLQQARTFRGKADNEYHAALRDHQQANGLSSDANRSANSTSDGPRTTSYSKSSSDEMSPGMGLMIGLAAGGIVAGGVAAGMAGAPKTNDGFAQRAQAERQQIADQNQQKRDQMAAQTFANQQNQIANLNASRRAEQDQRDQASLIAAISSAQNSQPSGGLQQQLSTLNRYPAALSYGPKAKP